MTVSRTWYVSCSPRSPEKIAPELAELAKLDGATWDENNQKKFAQLLKDLPSFEGSISKDDPAFSARDRFAPMQTFGFAYVDSSRRLRITPAGWRLINGVRPQELFLKQFLKWQYPSWQHGGNPNTRHKYPPHNEMNIFPFVETLRACYELDGLSKEEIAIFLLPILRSDMIPDAIKKIQQFRKEKEKFTGRKRAEFIRETHFKEFAEVYSYEIKTRQFKTRESPTNTARDFLKKKINNSLDVADAAIRYFRATGIFTLSADYRRLVISPLYRREAIRILNEMEFKIVDFYNDVDTFYEYMGDPDIPQLPWETREELIQRAISLGVNAQKAQSSSVIDLKEVIEQKIQETKEQKLREYMVVAQSEKEVQDILRIFMRIKNKDVVDPALFFEWNVWRAFVSMDDCENAKPNFKLDDDLRPLSTAPGNKCDMEIEYNNSFVLLVEVTLSTGARQYDTESEPVTRHIGKYQKAEMAKPNARTVYGLFIAPKIHSATRDYFYVHLKHFNNPEFGGYLNIIALNTSQFIDIFRFVKSLRSFNRNIIKDLLDRIINLREVTTDGNEWETKIPVVIEEWKRDWSYL